MASTMVGARRLDQLDANLAALDELSKPSLNFPANFFPGSINFMHNGLTVNGVPSESLPLVQPLPHAQD